MSDDKIYSKKIKHISDFAFDEKVAAVFEDMLERSIPAYHYLLSMLGVFVKAYYQSGTVCYDLGCSLGAASLAMAGHLPEDEFKIIAVDSSAAMIKRCEQNIKLAGYSKRIDAQLADIGTVQIANASIVVLNFTLQFVAPEKKQAVLEAVYQGLVPGGCLVLSEKCPADEPAEADQLEELYYRFKRLNGYSSLEIQQKREALEKVLFAESPHSLKQRLHDAGFSVVSSWFQCLQFRSYCAIK